MPWRGPQLPGEFPTLGYLVADWVEQKCAVPDRERRGQKLILTDEQIWWYVWFYRLNPEAREDSPETAFHYPRGGQLVRPQKWGKGPLAAATVCAEAAGPVRFAGWDADGEPVGRPWATPLIQITAVSEDQTANVWRPLVPMIELGDIAADIPDTGETRINLKGGGRIEPVTASARSRLGNPITFAVQDETHSWVQRNGGRALADNQRRNLAGMGGRWMETTNAWDPAEDSVAQATAKETGVYHDDVEPPEGSFRDLRQRRRILKVVYGDSWRRPRPEPDRRVNGWVELARLDEEIDALMARDPAQAERYFGNRKQPSEGRAFDLERWGQQARPGLTVPQGELIVIGVDGARFDDAVAVVATDVVSGHQWPLGIWERPAQAPDGYEHPAHVIDGAVSEAWEHWQVWRVYVDPQWIEHLRDTWQGRWGKNKVLDWYTNRPRQIVHAVRAYLDAIAAGSVTHADDPLLNRHIRNARKRPTTIVDDDRRPMFELQKDRPGSPDKIDGAMAAVLSHEARRDALAAGARKRDNVAVFY